MNRMTDKVANMKILGKGVEEKQSSLYQIYYLHSTQLFI